MPETFIACLSFQLFSSRFPHMSILISGGYSDGAPPLPIPNREVKPVRADGTASSGRVGSRRFFPEESGIPHNVECRISYLYNMHQGRFRLPRQTRGERFHKPKEKSCICTMNPQGLLALAQLILPSEILSNFEVVRVEEESSLIRIYLGESVRAEYKENSKIESKGVLWVHPKSLGD